MKIEDSKENFLLSSILLALINSKDWTKFSLDSEVGNRRNYRKFGPKTRKKQLDNSFGGLFSSNINFKDPNVVEKFLTVVGLGSKDLAGIISTDERDTLDVNILRAFAFFCVLNIGFKTLVRMLVCGLTDPNSKYFTRTAHTLGMLYSKFIDYYVHPCNSFVHGIGTDPYMRSFFPLVFNNISVMESTLRYIQYVSSIDALAEVHQLTGKQLFGKDDEAGTQVMAGIISVSSDAGEINQDSNSDVLDEYNEATLDKKKKILENRAKFIYENIEDTLSPATFESFCDGTDMFLTVLKTSIYANAASGVIWGVKLANFAIDTMRGLPKYLTEHSEESDREISKFVDVILKKRGEKH